jgi:hypothetical protein
MVTTAHRSTAEPPEQGFLGIFEGDAQDDITTQLATRVGELYASEEMRQRVERTDRMIQRAWNSGEE